MSLDFSKRSREIEIMDDFNLGEDPEFKKSLDSIATINRWLGGNKPVMKVLKSIFLEHADKGTLKIIDIGCGNGDMCREIAKLAQKQDLEVEIVGIDANRHTVKYAEELSAEYPNIRYLAIDAFSSEFLQVPVDIYVSTLTIHHFDNEILIPWLIKLCENCKISIIINDLHRSRLAYRLFQVVCTIFRLNEMSTEDGKTSILKAFIKEDFMLYSDKIRQRIPSISSSISWKWAFRYLWIIQKR